MSEAYRRQDYRALLDEMILSPGTWTLAAVNVNRTTTEVWAKRGCETTVRKNNSGKYDIYARWPHNTLEQSA